MISVIIPAYKATKFIDECLDSIKGVEILVGVDSCQETLDHLIPRKNIRLFFFTKNVGPYVIKNSLVDEATHDNILFFDADDVLASDVIPEIEKALENKDYVKLKYINFYTKITTQGHKMSDAVIAIKRPVFNKLNGFYPWRCAADTEFAHRLEYNKLKCEQLECLAYHRRLHNTNLTVSKETGHGSAIRNSYISIISRNQKIKHWENPPNKQTETYVNYPAAS